MNKDKSLTFLQSCINSINIASEEEIALLKEKYNADCVLHLESSDFKFIPSTESEFIPPTEREEHQK